jgi:endonuclease/exonuclease/phosphatase family metal-dependent hydrolase
VGRVRTGLAVECEIMGCGGRRSACALLGFLLCALPSVARGDVVAGMPLSVLSYNVHGISWLFAKDNPVDRAVAIGWLADRYDVVLLQEDFEYHDRIGDQMPNAVALRGNRMRGDPRLLLSKLVLLPFQILLPRFTLPYGSGLSAFVSAQTGTVVESHRRKYSDCSGWVGRSFDCWATKGILRFRLRMENDAEIDFYNTHLDAGQTSHAIKVRERQIAELVGLIDRESAGRAVVVAGDFNTALSRMENVESMRKFKRETGLLDVGAGPQLPQWPRRDFIFARDGEHVGLDVRESGEALEFVNRTRTLSDHPAVFVRFEVTAR